MFTARLAIYHYWLFKMEFIQESFFSSVACSESPSKTCFFSRQQCIGIPSTRQRFQKLFWFLRGYVILLLHSHQLYVLHTHGNDISVNQTLNHSRFSFTFIHPTYKRDQRSTRRCSVITFFTTLFTKKKLNFWTNAPFRKFYNMIAKSSQ